MTRYTSRRMVVVLLVLIGMVITSREAVAQGGAPGQGSVPGQGSAPVTIVNPLPVPVQLGIASRYVATQFAGVSPFGVTLVPLVETGKTFIVTFLNVAGFSNNSAVSLTDGHCTLRLLTAGTSSAIGSIPIRINMGIVAGSEAAFLPLNEGEGLSVSCFATPINAEFRINVSGYFVPAVH